MTSMDSSKISVLLSMTFLLGNPDLCDGMVYLVDTVVDVADLLDRSTEPMGLRIREPDFPARIHAGQLIITPDRVPRVVFCFFSYHLFAKQQSRSLAR
ncbi:hypothetical protein BJY52DRAFT_354717 [Lactarius psammicola]|nr:hypothetical protein BJY52DRAFT_354717 [Lactarius psammicola]